MECIKSEIVNINWFGGVPAPRRVRAVIVASEAPADLTDVTGADVDGLDDNDVLAIGSTIITPAAEYIATADGSFEQMGASTEPA